jgi:hypothetical protein
MNNLIVFYDYFGLFTTMEQGMVVTTTSGLADYSSDVSSILASLFSNPIASPSRCSCVYRRDSLRGFIYF